MDKYLSCGRDGSVRLWAAEDVKHARTIANGGSWVTDVLHLRRSRRLVVASMDRAITTYDIHRECEQVGKVRGGEGGGEAAGRKAAAASRGCGLAWLE
jgi:WD40 repeat protein